MDYSAKGNEETLDANKPSVKNLSKSESIFNWFFSYFLKFFSEGTVKVDPFDTLILKAHYNFTSYLLFTCFVFATSHQFIEEPILCFDRTNKEKGAPEELLDICLSYPYKEYPLNNDKNNMVRQYALHYRWVHIACLILSFVYKSVIIGQKVFGYQNYSKILVVLTEEKITERFLIARRYFINSTGCHKNIYSRFLYVHLFALFVNCTCFAALNITFQNEYWTLPKHLFLKRDSATFEDAFSIIFPRFTLCEITAAHHILLSRTKWYGCHLPLMEIYEKIFMIFWFWQAFLAIWTVMFILYNIPLSFCPSWKLNLLSNSSFNRFDPFQTFAKVYPTDEIFAIRAVAILMLGGDFARLLSLLIKKKKGKAVPMDPDDTVYFENEPQSKDTTFNSLPMNATSFHSCNDEGIRSSNPPVGFEFVTNSSTPFKDKPNASTGKLSTVNYTCEPSINNDVPYFAWKRSVSLEFNTSPLQKSMYFNSKVQPLMKYLNRGILSPVITTSTPPAPSAPYSEEGSFSSHKDYHAERGNQNDVNLEVWDCWNDKESKAEGCSYDVNNEEEEWGTTCESYKYSNEAETACEETLVAWPKS